MKDASRAIDYLESAAPHLRIFFGQLEFEHFASLIENYAFSEAYDALMGADEKRQAEERFRIALELRDLGIDMMRERLRREYPGSSEADQIC